MNIDSNKQILEKLKNEDITQFFKDKPGCKSFQEIILENDLKENKNILLTKNNLITNEPNNDING